MITQIFIEGQYPSRVKLILYLKSQNSNRASLIHKLPVKKSMKGIVIFSFMLILGAGETFPQQSASSEGPRLGAIPFPGQTGNSEKPKYIHSENNFELKCENDRGICKGQCNALGYLAGECVDDVCYCLSGHHTAIECDRIVGEVVESERHKSCKIHCQLLRKEFDGGECIGGKCLCKEQSHYEKATKNSPSPTSFWQ